MRSAKPAANPLFPLTALFAAAFVVTVLATIANVFGDPAAPLGRWLDRHAGWLLAAEVAAILTSGGAALALDRRQILSGQRSAAAQRRDDAERGTAVPAVTSQDQSIEHSDTWDEGAHVGDSPRRD